MPEQDFYFNPFDADFRANPYPHFPALLEGPPRQLKLFMPTTLVARYDDVVTVLTSRAIPADQLDTKAAAAELEKAQSLRTITEIELADQQKAVARARGMIRVGGHKG